MSTWRQSTPSFSSVSITKRPSESAPTRLSHATLKPRRDRPMATLLSAPAMRLWNWPTLARSPACSATNIAMVSPNDRISISDMCILPLRLAQMGESGDGFAGPLHQGIASQRVFRRAHDTLGHVPQQVFPLLQVAGGGRYGDQLAVGATGHRFAVHIVHMAPEQSRSARWRLVLPVPIADIEGHPDWQAVLLDLREKALEGLDATAVQGLVVFH